MCGFFMVFYEPESSNTMRLYLRRTLVRPEYNSALGCLHISILNFPKANRQGK